MTDRTVSLRITGDAAGYVRAAREADAATVSLGRNARENLGGIAPQAEAAEAATRRMQTSFVAAAAAAAGIALGAGFIAQIVEATNAVAGFERAFAAATGSPQLAGEQMAFVRAEAARLGVDLRATAGAYVSLTAAAQGTSLEGQRSREIFVSISEAMRVLGRSAPETAAALLAVEQMISKGKVSAEELRGQLGERLPGAFRLAAQAMGVTTQELDAMLSRGEVVAEQLLPKLAARLREIYSSGAAAAGAGPSADLERLGNAWTEFLAALGNAGVLDAVAGGARALTSALTAITASGALDEIVAGFGALAALGVGALFGRLSAAVVAYGVAQVAAARQTAALAAAQAAATGATVAQSGALALVGTRLLALVGGPLGLAITLLTAGGMAWAAFGTGADQAAQQVQGITADLQAYNQAQQASAQAAVSASDLIAQGLAERARLTEQLIALERQRAELEGAVSSEAGLSALVGTEEQIASTTAAVQALDRELYDAWQTAGGFGTGAAAAFVAVAEQGFSLASVVDQVRQAMTQLGQVDTSALQQQFTDLQTALQDSIQQTTEQLARAQGRNPLVEQARELAAELRAVGDTGAAEALEALTAQQARLDAQLKATRGSQQAANAAAREAAQAAREQEQSMAALVGMLGRAEASTSPLATAQRQYADAMIALAQAAGAAIAAGNDLATVQAAVARESAAAGAVLEANVARIQREAAERAALASVIGAAVADLEREAQSAGMSARERATLQAILAAEQAARQAVNAGVRESAALTEAEIAQIRERAAAAMDSIDASRAAQRAAQDYQQSWLQSIDRVAGAFEQWLANGEGGFRELGRSLIQTGRQIVAQLAAEFLRNRIIIPVAVSLTGGAGGPLGGLLQAVGGGGGLGGLGGLGGILGSAGRGIGSLLGLGGAFSGAAATGTAGLAGSAFAGAAATGTAGLGGALGGLIGAAGPIGAALAAVAALSSLFRSQKPPDIRLGGSDTRIRNQEGSFQTDFGQIRAGSRQISFQSFQQPITDFDRAISDLVRSVGGGEEQLTAIAGALANWSVDLRGSAANVENVLGSRFGAILGTFSADVQAFVGGAGTVEERLARLGEALQIQGLASAGDLGSDFAALAQTLQQVRQGNESLSQTYARVLGGIELIEGALLGLDGAFAGSRAELVQFAADLIQQFGGLDQLGAAVSSVFGSLYTEAERQEMQIRQLRAAAQQALGAIGLDLAATTAEQVRALFEQALSGAVDAEQAAAIIRAASAYGALSDAVARAGDAAGSAADDLGQLGQSLESLLEDVERQLGEFAPPATFAQQFERINGEIAGLIARAQALGATEEQLQRIRELGAARLGAVQQAQQQALAQYQQFVGQFRAPEGLSEFGAELRNIQAELQAAIDQANAYAVAAGLSAASTEDLARIHEAFAVRTGRAIAGLEESAAGLIERLGYLDSTMSGVFTSTEDFALRYQQLIGASGGVDPERLDLATQLASQVREIAEALAEPVLAVIDRMRVPVERLLADLGVDLQNLGDAGEADALVQAARALGLELSELATRVSARVGEISDAGSIVNDALERAIERLPDSVRGSIEQLLRGVESAAPEDRAAAIAALESAVAGLAPQFQSLFAPFFDNVDVTAAQDQQLAAVQASNQLLSQGNALLTRILAALERNAADKSGGGDLATISSDVSSCARSLGEIASASRSSRSAAVIGA